MTSDYERRQAEWAKRAEAEEAAEREKEIIVGETTGEVEKDIKAGQELKVKIDEVGTLHLKLAEDLKKRETVRIIVKADPQLSEQHKMSWGREKAADPGEAAGTVTGKIKKDHDIKIKIDYIDVEKTHAKVELDRNDSIRMIVEKS